MENIIRLPLQNAYNVRELGGYAGTRGITKWKRFLRGDDISALHDEDITYLSDYGVTSVLDLRSNAECKHKPDVFVNNKAISYYHIPFMVGDVDNIMDTVTANARLHNFYVALLKDKACVKKLMECIAQAPKGCMLFHCTGGKDRTGVLSMLLLTLVDVVKEDVIANYQVSYTYLRRNHNLLNCTLPKDMDMSCMYSSPESIEKCLDYIYANYSNTEQYLLACGVSEGCIYQVIQKLVG